MHGNIGGSRMGDGRMHPLLRPNFFYKTVELYSYNLFNLIVQFPKILKFYINFKKFLEVLLSIVICLMYMASLM